jgi:hypothetical protein
MKLPFKRSKPKKAQAADVVGAVAKFWSELQLSKRASKGVKKGSKKAAAAKSAVGSKAGSKPAKVAGGLALLGGVGALVARKLKGGGAEPLPYSPPEPPPSEEELASVRPAPPDEPPIVVEDKPIELEDLAAEEGDPDEPAGEEPASEGPSADEFNDDNGATR